MKNIAKVASLSAVIIFFAVVAFFGANSASKIRTAVTLYGNNCPAQKTIKNISVPLKFGQKSSSVTILNSALNCLGYLKKIPSKTVLGNETAKALTDFYKSNGYSLKVVLKNKQIVFDKGARELLVKSIQTKQNNFNYMVPPQGGYGFPSGWTPPDNSAAPGQYSGVTEIAEDYVLPDEYKAIFAQSDWEKAPKLPQDFKIGHTLMDYYSDLYYKSYMDSTLDSVKKSGVGWVAFDNYNTYSTLEPPKIGPFPLASDSNRDTTAFREASEEELTSIVERAHRKGLKFFLMTEINYDGLAKKQAAGATTELADDLSKYSKRFQDLGLTLDNGGTPDGQIFWDQWFAMYTDFIVGQAKIAQKTGVEMFAVGKQTSSATHPANAGRWKELIRKVREVYKGDITYVALEGKDFSEAAGFPAWSDLDFATLTLGNLAPATDNKSVSDLKSSLQNTLTSRFKKFADQTGKKVIILSYSQSATTQEWFEPSPPIYNSQHIVKDLLAQAKLYEALFQAVKDESWVAGVFTWGYWWKDDLTNLFQPGDSGYDKSSDVRGKPAMEIIKKWTLGY